MTWAVACPTCGESTPHVSNGVEIACTACGLVRPDDALLLLSQVHDMRFCAYCNEKKPVGHDCPAGAVGCATPRDDGSTCGRCEPCCRAQQEWLAAQGADFQQDPFGSPSDIDFP